MTMKEISNAALMLIGLVITSMTATSAHAGPLNLTWSSIYDSGNDDTAVQMAVDMQGNTFVVGTSDTPTEDENITIAAYDAQGNQLWSDMHNGSANGQDLAAGVAVDGLGHVYVVGRTQMPEFVGSDIVLLKYRIDDGARLWTRTFDGPGSTDEPNDLAVDGAGDVVVAGLTLTSDEGIDYLVVKFSASGDVLWSARYSGPGPQLFQNDSAEAVAIDSNGDVVVTGHSDAANGISDYATIKYDGATGQQLWRRRYAGAGANDAAWHIAINSEDDVFVTGNSFQSGDKYATLRYDGATGQLLWEALDDPGFHDVVRGLALGADGDCYLIGTSDPDGDEGNFNDDIYTARRSGSNGSLVWSARYGESGFNDGDLARDLAVDEHGSVYVTGSTHSFDLQGDLVLLEYDLATGAELSQTTWDAGPNFFEGGNSVSVLGDAVYVSGTSAADPNYIGRFVTFRFESGNSREPADIDENGEVNADDLFQLLGAWGSCPGCPEDLTGDGQVNADDLFQLLGAWG